MKWGRTIPALGLEFPERKYKYIASLRNLYIVLLVASCVLVTSCVSTPFALSIDEFNEDPPQRKAAILVSDPQIYSRETLINDRLKEREFLDRLLAESAAKDFYKNFKPTLVRDLESITAINASLQAAFNPTLGASNARMEDLAGKGQQAELLKADIEIEKRKLELLKLQNATENALSPETTPPVASEGGETASEDGGSLGDVPTNDTSGLSGPPLPDEFNMDTIRADLESVLDRLSKRAGENGAKVSKMEADPIDAFRDVQAYRNILRQAKSEIELDDLHDHDGNSLYRMQFRATVLPGERKDKFGVAQLTLMPPIVDEKDIEDIYFSWLMHIASRVNPKTHTDVAGNRCQTRNAAFLGLDNSDFVTIFRLALRRKGLDFANYFTYRKQFQNYDVVNVDSNFDFGRMIDRCYLYIPLPLKVEKGLLNSTPNRSPITGILNEEGVVKVSPKQKQYIDAVTRFILETTDRENLDLSDIGICDRIGYCISFEQKFKIDTSSTINLNKSFEKFRDLVAMPLSGSKNYYLLNGDANVYQTAPAERAQRISTIVRTAKSLELALAASAALPTSGVSAEVGAGYLRQAAGAIETIERQPIVVGFAERRTYSDCYDENTGFEKKGLNPSTCPGYYGKQDLKNSSDSHPIFGWVFGPHVQADPKGDKLKLVQRPASHDVSADVSAPGWWPFVTAEVETAWVANWWNAGDAIKNLQDKRWKAPFSIFSARRKMLNPHTQRNPMRVGLPVAKADYDGLTEFLMKRTIGGAPDIMKIDKVSPQYLTACQDIVKITISGVNVWRSTRVLLAGAEATSVEVLPDMEGVIATFNMKDVYSTTPNLLLQSPARYQNVTLSVWTREGKDEETVRILGLRSVDKSGKVTCKAQQSIATTTLRDQFRIHNVTPAVVNACGAELNFFVKLDRDTSKRGDATNLRAEHFTLNGTRASHAHRVLATNERGHKPIPGEGSRKYDPGDNTPIYEVKFKGGALAKGAPTGHATLAATDGDNTSSASVQVNKCALPEAKKKEETPISATPTKVTLKPKYIIDGNKTDPNKVVLDFKIDHPKDAALNQKKYKFGLLPKSSATGTEYVVSDRAPKPVAGSETSSTGRYELVKKDNKSIWDDFGIRKAAAGASRSAKPKMGEKIRLVILDQSSKKTKAAHDLGEFIYYPDEADRHATQTMPAGFLDPGQSVEAEIHFPKFAADAYPKFKDLRISASATKGCTTNCNIKLKTTPEKVPAKGGSMKVKIEFDGPGPHTAIPTNQIELKFVTPDAPLEIK